MSRVVLAMSGGVDSSVAAWLLHSAGHEVTGVFMRHGQLTCDTSCATADLSSSADEPPKSTKQVCCSVEDAADARRVADRLKIPFYVLNFENQFDRIVDHFVDQYLAGRTPNPCILCNTWLKFGKLLDYADSVGAEFIATGHYARIVRRENEPPALLRGVDPTKDQAYALFGIDRKVLPRVMLPIGEYSKEAIRRMASEIGLAVAEKRDSQEICFVPDQDHAGFIRRRRPDTDTAGEVVTTDGKVVGRHDGIERFTVGQRKGLGIALGEPYFVVRIEPDTRRVVLGMRDELARNELTAGEANWLIERPTEPFRASVKIRYRSRMVEATVTPLAECRFHVQFDEPRHGVAPGQAAVCFEGDHVLGGGWIE